MTTYFSFAVLGLLLPLTVAAYQAAPRRARWAVLLAASYAFYWMVSGWLVVFVAGATAVSWRVGLSIDTAARARDLELASPGARRRELRARYARRMRRRLAVGVALVLGALVALRCQAPLMSAASAALGRPAGGGAALAPLGMPVGISFYSLQAVSYLADVYRGTCRADRNPARLALWLTFFPQVMEGPISRYGDTAAALWQGRPVTGRSLYMGGSRILWGLAKRLVVANRLNSFVQPVFEAPGSYDGGVIALAAVLYTLQLYCDFSGAMDFAVGAGRVFGADLPENFRQPFSSRTAAEFWRRWHVTLGSWLRDYVFYPVSLSAPVKRLGSRARRVAGPRLGPALAGGVALLCVWVLNGLWHGAGSQYLLFGMYYFAVIWAGSLLEPVAQSACERLGVSREGRPYRAMQRARTLLVIVAGELLFRACSAAEGAEMLARASAALVTFAWGPLVGGGALSVGMDAHDFAAVAAFSLALLLVGAARERGVALLEGVWRRGAVARWALWCALVVAAVVFGAYGAGYVPVDPMYAQF